MDKKLNSEELLKKFSNDASHPFEVRKLSMMIFDELNKKVYEFSKKDRKLIEAASLLHDIGYYIDSDKHNKHSYELIVKNGIEDFSEEDEKIVACICRYHRGRMPDKEKDEGYKDFDKKVRKKIKRLAGILRLSDGLDRAHMGLIKKVKIVFDEEQQIVEFILCSNTVDYRPDISFAIKKKDLFDKAFKVQSVFKFD